jgi:TolB protein
MIKCFQVCSCAVLVAIGFAGCVPGDSGGGGGLGSFSRGFAFVRSGNIYVADNSAYQNPIQLTTSGDDQFPSLSRDGRRVVYIRGGNQLWIVPASNSPSPARVQEASGGTNFRTPVFSPDGNSIVYAYNLNGVSQFGRVNVDGTGFQQLTSQFYYAGPSFYSNGLGVLAARGTSPSQYNQIVRVDVNTGTDSLITGSLGQEACSIANRVALSPDGLKAAFDARTSSGGNCIGPVRIFVMDLFSRTVNRLTDYPADPSANDGFPTWVGNDQVGFSSNVGGADQIYVLPANSVRTSGGLKVPTASQPYYGPN